MQIFDYQIKKCKKKEREKSEWFILSELCGTSISKY